MITCPKCQFQNKDEHHFCISCGSTIKILESASPVSREEFNTLRSHVDSLRQALISRGIKLEESRQENRPIKTSPKTPSQQATPKRINLNMILFLFSIVRLEDETRKLYVRDLANHANLRWMIEEEITHPF